MKKLFLFIIILLTYSCSNTIKDLKKETFRCTGYGGTGKNISVSFSIEPSAKTLIFSQNGGLMGSLLNYPKSIWYDIKSSSGNNILTKDYTYSWTNRFGKTVDFISYIKTNDKKTFEYGFRQAKGRPYIFENCEKIN